MKGYSSCFKWVIAFILVLMPTLVLAQEVPSSPLWDMFQNLSFTPPKTDISVSLLGKMFGAVPGVPQLSLTGSTIVGAIFGVFNAGVLAISGVFLSYTIVRIVTETTMDGAAMGKSTTIWTAVRCALSTALLVPQPSGYSMVNGIVMWVVMQSIGLADRTWERALDYLEQGGPLYVTKVPAIDYTLINYDLLTGKSNIDATRLASNAGSADVLRSLICSYSVYGALKENQKRNYERLFDLKQRQGSLNYAQTREFGGASTAIPEKSSEVFAVANLIEESCDPKGSGKDVCRNGLYEFPFVKGENNATYPLKDNYGLTIIGSMPKLTGICGKIGYTVYKGSDTEAIYAEKANRYNSAKKSGLQGMIAILEPIAKKMVDRVKQSEDGGKRDLDPNTYIVYKDSQGNEKKFLSIATDSINSASLDLQNQTIYSSFYSRDFEGKDGSLIGTLPTINWPYGADEMMQAAATYQLAVATARTGSAEAIAAEKKRLFDAARRQGWIGAGGYYRLLTTVQNVGTSENMSYRLDGYKESGERMHPESFIDSQSTDYRDLYFKTLLPQGDTKLKSIEVIGKIDSGGGPSNISGDTKYQDALTRGLVWTNLTYPYAKLRGQVLSRETSELISQIPTGVGLKILFASPVPLGVTIGMLTVGAIQLAIMPPAAIPLLTPVPLLFLQDNVADVFNVWNDEMNSPGDPIIKLKNVGNRMIKSAANYILELKIFLATISLSLTIANITYQFISWGFAACSFWGACSGASTSLETQVLLLNGMIELTQTMIFMYLPIGLAILIPLLVTGMTLAIYVPLIPFLLFLFGVVSWLISVLVLMAAAPIICFLMLWGNSSQENPLLAREAEQFLMQVVGIFFRPTLMIIGLITGIVLSYISVDVLNLGFANVANFVLEGNAGLAQDLKGVGLAVIYTFVMVSLLNMCFSTIHLLYSEAMRVVGISVPAVGMEEKYAEAAKAGATQIAEAGAGGMKEGAVAMKGARTAFQPTKKEKKEEKPASGASGK